MSGILQGTTPELIITVPEDFPLANVVAVELTLQHKNVKTVLGTLDVVIDPDSNTITYTFTEAQTLALDPKALLMWQLRMRTNVGKIVGTLAESVSVYDLLSDIEMGV